MTTQPIATDAHLFKSPMPYWAFVFPDGSRANFIKGIYITSNTKEIAWLNAEVALNHPAITIDPKEITVSLDRSDPVGALKAKLRMQVLSEIAAEMAAATNPANDMGNTDAGKFTPASTSSIAAVTANGDASARISALRNSVAKIAAETPVVKQTGPVPLEIPAPAAGE